MTSGTETDVLTLDEIAQRHEGEWVLIDAVELAANNEVVRGNVLWHGGSRREAWQQAQVLHPTLAAVYFFGTVPDEPVFIL